MVNDVFIGNTIENLSDFTENYDEKLSISDVLNLAVILETKARAVILSNETNLK